MLVLGMVSGFQDRPADLRDRQRLFEGEEELSDGVYTCYKPPCLGSLTDSLMPLGGAPWLAAEYTVGTSTPYTLHQTVEACRGEGSASLCMEPFTSFVGTTTSGPLAWHCAAWPSHRHVVGSACKLFVARVCLPGMALSQSRSAESSRSSTFGRQCATVLRERRPRKGTQCCPAWTSSPGLPCAGRAMRAAACWSSQKQRSHPGDRAEMRGSTRDGSC